MPNLCTAGHNSSARTYPKWYDCYPCHQTHSEASDPEGGPLRLPTAEFRPNCLVCVKEAHLLKKDIRTAYDNTSRLLELVGTDTDPQPLISKAYQALSDSKYHRLLHSSKIFNSEQTWNTMHNQISAGMLNLRYVQGSWQNAESAQKYLTDALNNISVSCTNMKP